MCQCQEVGKKGCWEDTGIPHNQSRPNLGVASYAWFSVPWLNSCPQHHCAETSPAPARVFSFLFCPGCELKKKNGNRFRLLGSVWSCVATS